MHWHNYLIRQMQRKEVGLRGAVKSYPKNNSLWYAYSHCCSQCALLGDFTIHAIFNHSAKCSKPAEKLEVKSASESVKCDKFTWDFLGFSCRVLWIFWQNSSWNMFVECQFARKLPSGTCHCYKSPLCWCPIALLLSISWNNKFKYSILTVSIFWLNSNLL